MTTPQFGHQEPAWTYEPRPGAYALILRQPGELLIVRNVAGNCGLPGGGMDVGENPKQALEREVREETGHAVSITKELCRANQFVVAGSEGAAFNKQGIFYIAELGEKIAEPTEPDHFAEWILVETAARELTKESQRWAVGRLREMEPGASRSDSGP